MTLEDVGILATDSSRTRAYLAALATHELLPAHAIFLTGGSGAGPPNLPIVPYFDNSRPALEMIHAAGIPCDVVDTGNVNSVEVVAAVKDSLVDVLIYSGTGGAILRPDILSAGKRFLHIHPGLVPRFRGSTTVYYSLLVDGSCGASAIFLEQDIDAGPIVASRTYPPPEDRETIDHGYDPCIRSDLLVRVLVAYRDTGEFPTRPQAAGGGETYYIMHPILRHITILSGRSGSGGAT